MLFEYGFIEYNPQIVCLFFGQVEISPFASVSILCNSTFHLLNIILSDTRESAVQMPGATMDGARVGHDYSRSRYLFEYLQLRPI